MEAWIFMIFRDLLTREFAWLVLQLWARQDGALKGIKGPEPFVAAVLV